MKLFAQRIEADEQQAFDGFARMKPARLDQSENCARASAGHQCCVVDRNHLGSTAAGWTPAGLLSGTCNHQQAINFDGNLSSLSLHAHPVRRQSLLTTCHFTRLPTFNRCTDLPIRHCSCVHSGNTISTVFGVIWRFPETITRAFRCNSLRKLLLSRKESL